MSKKITLEQIAECAKKINVPVAALRAVMDVEARGSGFLATGEPVILFEPHVFYQRLEKNGKLNERVKVMSEKPHLCYARWGTHKYGKTIEQHSKLAQACEYDRNSALEACSWGLGQVMGYHWKLLGYSSLQGFINAMYRDEAGQLDAMCRFIQVNGLDKFMRSQEWAKFAYRYNGAGYKKNRYDEKLAVAYRKYS